MPTFKVIGSAGEQSQTHTFEQIRYSGQFISSQTGGTAIIPPAQSFLLLEDASFILQEDGFKIKLESSS